MAMPVIISFKSNRRRLQSHTHGGGVHLVAVPIDYSENTRVLIDELREKLKTVVEPAA